MPITLPGSDASNHRQLPHILGAHLVHSLTERLVGIYRHDRAIRHMRQRQAGLIIQERHLDVLQRGDGIGYTSIVEHDQGSVATLLELIGRFGDRNVCCSHRDLAGHRLGDRQGPHQVDIAAGA